MLEDGSKVSGRVVHLDKDGVVLEVDGAEREFAAAQIKACVFGQMDPAAGGAADASRVTPPSTAAPGGETAPADGAATARLRRRVAARDLWGARMNDLDTRFPWLFPNEPMQWISLGIMLFALLSLAAHFSARIVGTENPSFGRGTLMGLWFLVAGIAQVAMVPTTAQALGGAVLGNLVATIVLYRMTYGLALGSGFLATVLLAVQGALGYGLLVLVDATLRSIGNATY